MTSSSRTASGTAITATCASAGCSASAASTSSAAAADMARLAACRNQRAAAGLGHRPALDQREAEARLECRVVLGIGVGAIAEAYAMGAILGGRRELHEHRGHDAEIVDDGCAG